MATLDVLRRLPVCRGRTGPVEAHGASRKVVELGRSAHDRVQGRWFVAAMEDVLDLSRIRTRLYRMPFGAIDTPNLRADLVQY